MKKDCYLLGSQIYYTKLFIDSESDTDDDSEDVSIIIIPPSTPQQAISNNNNSESIQNELENIIRLARKKLNQY